MTLPRGVQALLLVALAVTPLRVYALSDLMFAGNFEAPPLCSMPGGAGCPGFFIETPTVQINPGEAIAYCYYFDTPNTATLGIGRFSVDLGFPAAHIIVYNTYSGSGGAPADREVPGTLSSSNCGFTASTNNTYARRIFSSHESSEVLTMPSDDGGGTPLAIELLANQPTFIEMYFVNPSGSPVNASLRLRANGLDIGQAYTKTATYMTYNSNILVAPLGVSSATASCAVPAAVNFWWFSTHTHQFATSATLSNSNGPTTIVSSSDWNLPLIAEFSAPAFYQFGPGEKLTYSCDYTNNTPNPISDGDSYTTNENCVGIGYFFPANGPLICLDNIGPL